MNKKTMMNRVRRRQLQLLSLTCAQARMYCLTDFATPRNPRLCKLYHDLESLLETGKNDDTQNVEQLTKDILSRSMPVLREHPPVHPRTLILLFNRHYSRPWGKDFLYWGRVTDIEDDLVVDYCRYLWSIDEYSKIYRHELWGLAKTTLEHWEQTSSYQDTYRLLQLAIVADETVHPISVLDAMSYLCLLDQDMGHSDLSPATAVLPTNASVTDEDKINDLKHDIGQYMVDDAVYYLNVNDSNPEWRPLCKMYEQSYIITENMTTAEKLIWWQTLKADMLAFFRPVCQKKLKNR